MEIVFSSKQQINKEANARILDNLNTIIEAELITRLACLMTEACRVEYMWHLEMSW